MPEANPTPSLSNQIRRNPPHGLGATPKPKLPDRLREALRPRHYSRRTEQTCRHWVKRFIYFHKVRHPAEMAGKESLFSLEKRLTVLPAPLRWWARTHKDYKIVVRVLFNCQRALIMGIWDHSLKQSRPTESP